MQLVMTRSRKSSVVILITLAELAWLAALGLLFAYRGKVGELGRIKQELNASNSKRMTAAEDWERRQADSERLGKRFAESQEMEKELLVELEQKNQLLDKSRTSQEELSKLRSQVATGLSNLDAQMEQLRGATNRVAELDSALIQARSNISLLLADERHREKGEFSVRRELIGLPGGDLHRVIFLVDTSSSMRNSSSWESAKVLVRKWLEFLPMEECAIVNFNDTAVGFPTNGYYRIRQKDGTELRNKREELLSVFDRAGAGTYTDLLRGLRLAYKYPQPDVMVLFTDGHPHVSARSDAALARDIFQEVGRHQGVPILTVALGNYETEGAEGPWPKTNAAIAFLKELGRRSGGTFLGR